AAGVAIHETFVGIHPGTKISSDDQKALDAVLKNFDKSLYKIRTYDRGKLVKTQGSLEDARIPEKLVAEVRKASQEGISGFALGLTDAYVWQKDPTPTPPPATSTRIFETKRLVRLVTPILQKS